MALHPIFLQPPSSLHPISSLDDKLALFFAERSPTAAMPVDNALSALDSVFAYFNFVATLLASATILLYRVLLRLLKEKHRPRVLLCVKLCIGWTCGIILFHNLCAAQYLVSLGALVVLLFAGGPDCVAIGIAFFWLFLSLGFYTAGRLFSIEAHPNLGVLAASVFGVVMLVVCLLFKPVFRQWELLCLPALSATGIMINFGLPLGVVTGRRGAGLFQNFENVPTFSGVHGWFGLFGESESSGISGLLVLMLGQRPVMGINLNKSRDSGVGKTRSKLASRVVSLLRCCRQGRAESSPPKPTPAPPRRSSVAAGKCTPGSCPRFWCASSSPPGEAQKVQAQWSRSRCPTKSHAAGLAGDSGHATTLPPGCGIGFAPAA